MIEDVQSKNVSMQILSPRSIREVNFENDNIKGSISLKGAVIDDLTFKKYNTELDSNENVTLLNPRNIKDGYFIEAGWTSLGNKIKVPTNQSEWKVEGDRLLTEKRSCSFKMEQWGRTKFYKKN